MWMVYGPTHGSLNVPIEHHPTIRYMVYNGYYKVMSNIPKMGHLPTPATCITIAAWKRGWCRVQAQGSNPVGKFGRRETTKQSAAAQRRGVVLAVHCICNLVGNLGPTKISKI